MFEDESETAEAIKEVRGLRTLDVLSNPSYNTMKICLLPVLDIHCSFVGLFPSFGSVIPVKTENVQPLPAGGLRTAGSYTTIGVGSRSRAQV
jgi:hypothetical protein